MRAVSWSLFALLSVGCANHPPPADVEIKGNLEAMREALPLTVTEPAHAATVAHSIDAMRDQLVAFEHLSGQFRADLTALNARPDATLGEFDALLQKYDAERLVIRNEVERLHFQMIDATTSEQWAALAKFEHAALSAAAGA